MSLPKGWINVKFTDVLDVQGGTQPPKSQFINEPQDGYVRLLQIRDFGKRPVPTYIPDTSKLKKVTKNDILIGRYGASVGRICTGMEGAYNVALAKVLKTDDINSGYLRYYLLSTLFQIPLSLISRSAQNGFNKQDLAEIDFLLPPLNEQKRIAKKLDELLSTVESIKSRLDNAPNIIKKFRQSILAAATSGKLTEEWRKENNVSNKWESVTLKDTTTKVGSGSTPKGGKSAYKESGIPLVRSMNIHFYGIKYKDLAFIDDEQAKKLSNVIIQEKDVLLNITGASIGRVTLAPLDLVGARVNQHVSIIRTKEDMLIPEYLNIYLAAPVTQKWIQTENYGGTREALTKTMILDYKVSKPLIEEQKEIVSRVESLFALADTLEEKIEAAKKRVDKLTQSILAKAFKGELVPQDPNDEPAEELLKRIKAEQEKEKPKKIRKKNVKKKDTPTKDLLKILREKNRAISAKNLLSLSSYENNIDDMEEFYVQLHQLQSERRIRIERYDNEDWISFCAEGNI